MRSQPSSLRHSLVSSGTLPVALHHLRALHHHLAGPADRHLLAGVQAHDLLEGIGEGRAAGFQLDAVQRVGVGGRAGLGEPVALRHQAAVDGLHALRHLRRQGSRAGDDHPQSRGVEAGRVREVGHGQDGRRRQVEVGHAVLVRQMHHLLHVEPHHHDAGRTQGKAGAQEHRHPVDVEEGQRAQGDSVRRKLPDRQALLDVAGDVEVSEHHALGKARRAAGVRQRRHVLAGVDGHRPVLLRDATQQLLQPVDRPDVTQTGQFRPGGLHRSTHKAEHEDGDGLGVAQLVLDLTLTVEGVEGGDRGSRQENAVEDGGVVDVVGREDSHFVALPDAMVLEETSYLAGLAPDLAVGARGTIGADEGRLVGEIVPPTGAAAPGGGTPHRGPDWASILRQP